MFNVLQRKTQKQFLIITIKKEEQLLINTVNSITQLDIHIYDLQCKNKNNVQIHSIYRIIYLYNKKILAIQTSINYILRKEIMNV